MSEKEDKNPIRDPDQREWKTIGLIRKKDEKSKQEIRKKDGKPEKDDAAASTRAVVNAEQDENKQQDAGRRKRPTFRDIRDKLLTKIVLIAAGARMSNPSAYQPYKRQVKVKKGTKPKDPSSERATRTFCGMRVKFRVKPESKSKSSSNRGQYGSDKGPTPRDTRDDAEGIPPPPNRGDDEF